MKKYSNEDLRGALARRFVIEGMVEKGQVSFDDGQKMIKSTQSDKTIEKQRAASKGEGDSPIDPLVTLFCKLPPGNG